MPLALDDAQLWKRNVEMTCDHLAIAQGVFDTYFEPDLANRLVVELYRDMLHAMRHQSPTEMLTEMMSAMRKLRDEDEDA